jgi:hypothetical protein
MTFSTCSEDSPPKKENNEQLCFAPFPKSRPLPPRSFLNLSCDKSVGDHAQDACVNGLGVLGGRAKKLVHGPCHVWPDAVRVLKGFTENMKNRERLRRLHKYRFLTFSFFSIPAFSFIIFALCFSFLIRGESKHQKCRGKVAGSSAKCARGPLLPA